MIKLSTLILATAITVTANSSTLAAWAYQTNEDPFTDKVLHIAVGVEKNYALGFRCSDDSSLEMIFITPEKFHEDVEMFNIMEPQVLIRFDSAPGITLPTQIKLTSDSQFTSRTIAEVERLAKSAASAERRMAVAITVLGERFHAVEFAAAGSSKPINQMLAACGFN